MNPEVPVCPRQRVCFFDPNATEFIPSGQAAAQSKLDPKAPEFVPSDKGSVAAASSVPVSNRKAALVAPIVEKTVRKKIDLESAPLHWQAMSIDAYKQRVKDPSYCEYIINQFEEWIKKIDDILKETKGKDIIQIYEAQKQGYKESIVQWQQHLDNALQLKKA